MEAKALDLEQGSDEWLAARRKFIGSSDACIIMKTVDWSTPYELWREKTGRPRRVKRSGNTFAMDLGNRFEPAARSLFELRYGSDFEPVVLIHPDYDFMIASLDGRNLSLREILEIKCVRGDVFEDAKKGILSPKYKPQCHHQLITTGDKKLNFWVNKLDNKNGRYQIIDSALVEVYPDEAYHKELLFEEMSFMDFVKKDIPPPLTEDDYLWVEDESSKVLFNRMKNPKDANEAKEIREELIEHVEAMFNHPKLYHNGVTMTKTKKGHWMILIE